MRRLTQEIVIERFKKAHPNYKKEYDYSKVKYINQDTRVIIICLREHREFKQTPYNHWNGFGCKKCSTKEVHKKQIKSFDKVIGDFKKVHGEKYDYSKVEYVNNSTNIIIICPIHNEFEQTPANHLNSTGCSNCAGNKLLTTEDFIKRAREIHGDRYDYSKVEYVNNSTNIIIICPIHKYFPTHAGKHIGKERPGGCPRCQGHYRTTEEAISDFKKVHGDRYDYSKYEYKGYNVEGIVICNKNDTLAIKIKNMIIKIINEENKLKPIYDDKIKEIINKEMKIKYGRSFYTHNRIKIGIPRASDRKIDKQTNAFTSKEIKKYKLIEKEIHGEFPIDYSHHMRGHGCNKCKSHGYNLGQKGYLYINTIYYGKKKGVKIGITNRLSDRIHELNVKNIKHKGIITELCHFYGDGKKVYEAEKYIKRKYEKKFNYFSKKKFPDGYKETMKYDDKLVDEIVEIIINKFKELKLFVDELESNSDAFWDKYYKF